MIEIRHRITNRVLFACDAENEVDAVQRAVKEKVCLRHSRLLRADLRGADLRGADLSEADLSEADLSWADLRGASLYGADLSGANLRKAKIDREKISIHQLSITGLRWHVLITDGFMRIGCKRFTHAEWAAFDDAQIAAMDSDAASFWADQKTALLALCNSQAIRAAKS